MPIKPENRSRYPKDWPAISRAARERAGWRCQHPGCAARQYAWGKWVRLTGNTERHLFTEWGQGRTYSEARQAVGDAFADEDQEGFPPTVIVLTVAHLNHQPEDCRPENLAAMCQRHHLAYDAVHHAQTAYMARRAARNNLELPLVREPADGGILEGWNRTTSGAIGQP